MPSFGGGKVILFGEHGVVHGHPALAAGLSRGVVAEAALADRDELLASPWGVEVAADAASEEPLARAMAAVLTGYPQGRAPARVRAEVSLPGGAGLGCSAALGVAVVAALDELYGVERTPEERGAYSLAWEHVFHGNPSGVDNTMAAVGGVAIYRRGEPLEAVRPRRPLVLVVGNSGESSSTKTMVEDVARQLAGEPERVEKVFSGMASLVQNGRLAIEAGDLSSLGQLMDLNQALLSSLLLSTTKLEAMCRAAREAGALGAKLTGAGGGGCTIALAEDEAKAGVIRDAVAVVAHEAFIATVGGDRP